MRPGYEYSDRGEVNCIVRYSPFSGVAVDGGAGVIDKQASVVLTNALTAAVDLDSFPKCTLDVNVEILQADGGACCVRNYVLIIISTVGGCFSSVGVIACPCLLPFCVKIRAVC